MSHLSAISLGIKTVAFAALNASTALNAIANRITGGKVNRDNLAQGIFRQAVDLGFDYATSSKSLGERHSRLVPAVRQAMVNNDHAQMQEGVKKLMQKLVPDAWQDTVGGLVTSQLGEHALEKALATTAQQYGRKPLADYIRNMLGSGIGRGFVAKQVMGVLERSVLSKAEYQQGDSKLYRLMAAGINSYLSGKPEDPPGIASRILGAAPVVFSTVQAARDRIDALAQDTGIDALLGRGSAQPTEGHAAHATTIERLQKRQDQGLQIETDDLPMLFHDEIGAKVTARDVVGTVIARECVGESVLAAPEATQMLHEQVQELQKALDISATLTPTQREGLEVAQKMVESEQVRPLGERGETMLAHTLTGQLARVEKANHGYLADDVIQRIAQQGEQALAQASEASTKVDGWSVASAYREHIGNLQLDLPGSAYGYGDMARQGLSTAWSAAWSVAGWGRELGMAQDAELRSLSNLCGGDAQVLEVVTRYLDPALAQRAVVDPLLQHGRDPQTGLVHTPTGCLRLQDGAPQLRFSVQNHGQLVSIALEAEWRIERFGADAQSLRAPMGDAPSTLTAGAVISITLPTAEQPLAVTHHASPVSASIRNVVAFDTLTGAIREGGAGQAE